MGGQKNGHSQFTEADIDFLDYNIEEGEDPLRVTSNVEITNMTDNPGDLLFVKTELEDEELEENQDAGDIVIKEEYEDQVNMEIKAENEIFIKEELEDY